jgi:hypothetical protein
MTKRILLYAALYGGIGAVVGVLMALYTKDVNVPSFSLPSRMKDVIANIPPQETEVKADE